MRILINDDALITNIQKNTGCDYATACEIVESITPITEIKVYDKGKEDGQKEILDKIEEMKNEITESINQVMDVALKSNDIQAIRDTSFVQNGIIVARGIVDLFFGD